MTIEIDFSYVIDGFYHSVNYYRSETPMNPESMPAATATGITDSTYTDTTATKGINYYVRFGSVRSGIEKISEEIRVLAGIAWTPQTIAALWLDSEHLTYDSSSRISTATDLSASGYNFSQSTDANKPIKTENIFNGIPSIRFNGTTSTGQWLGRTDANSLTANKSYLWCFSVLKNNTIVPSKNMGLLRAPVGDGNDRGRFTCISSEGGNSGSILLGARRLDSDSISTFLGQNISTNTVIVCFERDYTSATTHTSMNGSRSSSSVIGTTGLTSNTQSNTIPFVIGTESTVTNYLNADVACVVFGNTSLSTTNRQKLEGWAAHKYGLTANLPSDHPYKTNPPVV